MQTQNHTPARVLTGLGTGLGGCRPGAQGPPQSPPAGTHLNTPSLQRSWWGQRSCYSPKGLSESLIWKWVSHSLALWNVLKPAAPETTIPPRETLLQSSTLTFSDILIPNMEGSQLQVPRDTDRQPRAGIPPNPAEDDTKGQSGPQPQLFSAPKQDVVVYPCSQGRDLPR